MSGVIIEIGISGVKVLAFGNVGYLFGTGDVKISQLENIKKNNNLDKLVLSVKAVEEELDDRTEGVFVWE